MQAFIANRNSDKAVKSIDEILGITDPAFAVDLIIPSGVNNGSPAVQATSVTPSVTDDVVSASPIIFDDEDWLSF